MSWMIFPRIGIIPVFFTELTWLTLHQSRLYYSLLRPFYSSLKTFSSEDFLPTCQVHAPRLETSLIVFALSSALSLFANAPSQCTCDSFRFSLEVAVSPFVLAQPTARLSSVSSSKNQEPKGFKVDICARKSHMRIVID